MLRSTDVGLMECLSSGSSLLNHAPRRGGHSRGGLLPPLFSNHAVLPCLSAHSSLHNRVKYLTLIIDRRFVDIYLLVSLETS